MKSSASSRNASRDSSVRTRKIRSIHAVSHSRRRHRSTTALFIVQGKPDKLSDSVAEIETVIASAAK
jgi:hypothetical protein